MNYFTPEQFPCLTVYYDYEPEQKQTWYDPDFPEEFEFIKIICNGKRIGLALEEHLIETFSEAWEIELQELAFEEKEMNRIEKRMGY
jgi:hypothetical protein